MALKECELPSHSRSSFYLSPKFVLYLLLTLDHSFPLDTWWTHFSSTPRQPALLTPSTIALLALTNSYRPALSQPWGSLYYIGMWHYSFFFNSTCVICTICICFCTLFPTCTPRRLVLYMRACNYQNSTEILCWLCNFCDTINWTWFPLTWHLMWLTISHLVTGEISLCVTIISSSFIKLVPQFSSSTDIYIKSVSSGRISDFLKVVDFPRASPCSQCKSDLLKLH